MSVQLLINSEHATTENNNNNNNTNQYPPLGLFSDVCACAYGWNNLYQRKKPNQTSIYTSTPLAPVPYVIVNVVIDPDFITSSILFFEFRIINHMSFKTNCYDFGGNVVQK